MDRKFTVSFGRTVNTGNYSSLRLEISREYDMIFSHLTDEQIETIMKNAVQEVQKLVDEELERIMGEKA